jgi:hypothetical protein
MRSTLLRILGLICILIGIVASIGLMADIRILAQEGFSKDSLTSFVVLAFICLPGSLLLGRGKRLFALGRRQQLSIRRQRLSIQPEQLSIRTAKPIGDDPLVLYLRSFKDDPILANDEHGTSIYDPVSSEEQQIAHALKPLGRMVAIGSPADTLPPLGAERVYISQEGPTDWQIYVADLMRRATLVIVVADTTPGVLWELAEAVRQGDPIRIILLITDEVGYDSFRSVASFLPQALPEYPRGQRILETDICAAVYFDPDWKPHIVRLDNKSDYNMRGYGALWGQLESIIYHELAPALTRLGAPPPVLVRRTWWFAKGTKMSYRQRRMSIRRAFLIFGLLPFIWICLIAFIAIFHV